MKYEIETEFIVEPEHDGSKITSYNTQQHHILCMAAADPIDYHAEQMEEVQEYDELEDEDEETETLVSTARSDGNRTQTNVTHTNIVTQQQTNAHTKPSTTSQYHDNDPDERFLLSCLPIFKRLSNRKNALARMKIQQLLFDIEFSDDNS